MKWIKQNYDRFLLAVFALVLLVCAGLLITNARGYSEVFSSLKDQVPKKSGLGIAVNEKDILEKQQKLVSPELWKPRLDPEGRRLPLFVSVPYIDNNGKLERPDEKGAMFHPPVPNDWLMSNNQDLLAPNVLDQDTDGDGFSALDEYLGHTDPNNKDSHPPYYSKLFLKRFVRVPFHLRFDARNGNTYIVNTTDDPDARSQFVKIGQTVTLGKYKFKVTRFEEKFDTSQGFKKDVSELTLTNVDTGQQVVLPKEQDVDSPTTYAVLTYIWMGNKDFAVQRDGEFTLQPENNVKYKVLELSDTDVKVLKTDEKKQLDLRTQTVNR